MPVCPNCNFKAHKCDSFCENCGKKLDLTPPETQKIAQATPSLTHKKKPDMLYSENDKPTHRSPGLPRGYYFAAFLIPIFSFFLESLFLYQEGAGPYTFFFLFRAILQIWAIICVAVFISVCNNRLPADFLINPVLFVFLGAYLWFDGSLWYIVPFNVVLFATVVIGVYQFWQNEHP